MFISSIFLIGLQSLLLGCFNISFPTVDAYNTIQMYRSSLLLLSLQQRRLLLQNLPHYTTASRIRQSKFTSTSTTLDTTPAAATIDESDYPPPKFLKNKVGKHVLKALLPKRFMDYYLSRSPQITNVMKVLFYASFLIDATIILWGGRHTLSLLRSPSSTKTLLAANIHSIRQHVSKAFVAIAKTRHPMALSLLVFTIFYTMYHAYYIQQRQALDPTSEWERYAQYPIARTIAIFQIFLFEMVPLSLRIIIWQQLQKIMTPRIVKDDLSLHNDRYEKQIIQWKQHMGQVFANGLLQLGPLYIKMGQILSCRENVLPKEWKLAMERLQDQVPAQTGTKAQQLAERIWPQDRSESFHDVFIDVDWTPIAAASLGQVHTAALRATNERVALKLQRPKLRTIYDNDLKLLKRIATTVDKFFGSSAGSVGGISQSWTTIFNDAEAILYREIDYRTEAQNAIRFAKDFGLTKGGRPATIMTTTSLDGELLPSAASWLRTPYVYDTLSTEQILVMEYVPSIKISALEKLRRANVTIADREYLADCLGRSYLRQFCCNKFFSTDPHAGNLGVELLNMKSNKPEERVRLVYYDFGQATELQSNQADGILDIIEAIVDTDVEKSITSFQKMGVLKDNADLNAVRVKVADNYRTGKVKANRKKLMGKNYKFKTVDFDNSPITTTSTTTTTSDMQVMQYFTLPAEYAFVGRALTQMDGVGKVLDSDFDFISAAAPYIVEIKGAKLYVQDKVKKWLIGICNSIRSIHNPLSI